jgi:prepilin signal peptidase PulO-like enzyme (type II secretory pathway)
VTGHLLTAAGWLVLGAAAGFGIRRGSVWLARREELEPGFKPWQVWGPPILAAVLFAVTGWVFYPDWLLLVIKTLWVAVLVQVIFFDAEHRLILDRVIVPAIVLALVLSFFTPHLGFLVALLTGLGAGAIFLLLALAGAFLFGQEALGFGDVKLVAFIGAILGIYNVAIVTALFLGVLFAGVISLLLVVFRLRSMRDAIPYGPFLAAGALVVLFNLGAQ